MRPVLVVLALLACGAPSPAEAQTRRECRAVARNAGNMIGPAIVNLNRVEGMGRQIANLRSSSEDLRPTLDRFDEARQDLAVALRRFIEASRALRDASEACS